MADRANGVLLDSSVVIAYLRGRLDLRQRVAPNESLFLPLVGLGELYKGALKSTRTAQNLQQIGALLGNVAVLNPDPSTAMKYAEIATMLERTGALIPENDMWIAAVALECDMPLATIDEHFQRVPGLTVLDWR
ncbi:MAG: PIN domain-containing protein [Opitutaceae bacterium]